jgi:hypothetical protein
MPVQTTYPGVYVQELPSGAHSIAGVSTSITAFVGAATMGPVDEPTRIFSLADFSRVFGPAIDADHPLAYAVAHFFANGGSQAIVVRVLAGDAQLASVTLQNADASPKNVLVLKAAGKGGWANRGPGGGVEVSVDQTATANANDLFSLTITQWSVNPRTNAPLIAAQESYANLSMSPKHPRYALNLLGASNLVSASLASPAPTSTTKGTSVGAGAISAPLTLTGTSNTLRVSVDFGPAVDVVLFPTDTAGSGSVSKSAADIATELTAALGRAGLNAAAAQSSGTFTITSQTGGLNSSVIVTPAPANDVTKALKLGLAWGGSEVSGSAAARPATTTSPQGLTGGGDGSSVSPGDVVPASGTGGMYALASLPTVPRFNILCLPGLDASDDVQLGNALAYCKHERAFLIVDSPPGGFGQIPPNLGGLPALGEHGAIYYPRLSQVEALVGGVSRTLDLPACGAVAGVFARTDTERGVWKAPAGIGAGIVGVSGLTTPVDDNASGLLNPHGVNALRTFPGAGIVIWGARTLKGDDSQSSEFKYIPVRRLTDYIATSLYLGTQFAVFEPNDPDLWSQLRLAVGSFMRGLFRQGAFQQSSKRDEASSFFVVCDDTVNPQPEIDAGRVNVVVGFAPLKPAEFVVITITQISQVED